MVLLILLHFILKCGFWCLTMEFFKMKRTQNCFPTCFWTKLLCRIFFLSQTHFASLGCILDLPQLLIGAAFPPSGVALELELLVDGLAGHRLQLGGQYCFTHSMALAVTLRWSERAKAWLHPELPFAPLCSILTYFSNLQLKKLRDNHLSVKPYFVQLVNVLLVA
jgi:hypothetical protein